MDSRKLLDARALAAVFASSLAVALMLGASTGPPIVDVSDLRWLDSGAEVSVTGIVVDAERFDSGTDMFILLGQEGAETVKVIVSVGEGARPSDHVLVGDKLLVTGQLSNDEQGAVLYSRYEAVSVVARSEEALSVAIVCDNWQLFLWDEFVVRGRLVLSNDPVGPYALAGDDSISRLRLDAGSSDLSGAVGRIVVVSGTLVMERGDMSLELRAATVAISE